MSKELQLYDYQLKAFDLLREGFATNHRSQILYGPCSFGKTEVAIEMMRLAADKGIRSAMVMDRRILVEQTSKRMDQYGIDHGVYMADHWRFQTYKTIQLCSCQTLEAKQEMPRNIKLLIYDEAHCSRSFINDFIKDNPQVKVIGLTGSPFTKGLGNNYSRVVSSVTINELVDTHKKLAKMRVFVCKEIDMTGAKKTAGEWQAGEAGKRGVVIVGDVVSTWVEKTHEIYGEPKKTIVFCPDVATGKLYQDRFQEAGYNFKAISYKESDNDEVIEEFSRSDSKYMGLIATDILTKGFSVDDVFIGISARPFSKSFSSHVQQFGRIQRTHPEKEFGTWICHSGNYLRFLDQWDDLKENGVSVLDDGAEKTKKEPSKEEKEAAKCHKCGCVWGNTDICQNCGAVRVRKSEVQEVGGKVVELNSKTKNSVNKEEWYRQFLQYAKNKDYAEGWASHIYRRKFGTWPAKKHGLEPMQISKDVSDYIMHDRIRTAKGAK